MSAVIELNEKQERISSNGKTHRPYLFTVKTYDAMIEKGILTENDQLELLNGRIIEKMPKGTKHSAYNDAITRFFYKNADDKCVIRNQNPIRLDDFSEPEPDIVLAEPPREKYLERHPGPEDILLIVEIADSTLYFDRDEKGPAYARAGIRQYLIVNVENRTVEDYRDPSGDGYQTKQTLKTGEKIDLVAFPEIEIPVGDLLPQ
ncbi:MAG: Uma2 family endonuclease [Pyrinomonadaceae bacterium]